MARTSTLSYRRDADRVVPWWIDARDHGWIRLVIGAYERFAGERRQALDSYFEPPLPFACPRRKLALVRRVLDEQWASRVTSALPPREARRRVFEAAASRGESSTDAVLDAVGAELGVSPESLRASLLADLAQERRVAAPASVPSAHDVELGANLRLAQALLGRSMLVSVSLYGNARPVVRIAKLQGLICEVAADRQGEPPELRLSGPLSLFRRTTMYGRAMGSLLPALGYCDRYRLRAEVALPDGPATLTIDSSAPLPRGKEPARYDSQVERALARDLARVAPEWDVTREPEPVRAGSALIFPDFALTRRDCPERRVLVEVVGFWTPEYLERKAAHLATAHVHNLVVCLDTDGNVGEGAFGATSPIVTFRRRVDAGELMRVVREVGDRGEARPGRARAPVPG